MADRPPGEIYGDDLSVVHDTGFGDIARAAADLLLELIGGRGPQTIIELGCGSGISCAALAEAGHSVVGIDSSPAMLSLARRRVPSARFELGSWRSADLTECDAITAVGEVVNYLGPDDRPPTRGAVRRLGERARTALRPGGVLLLDVAGPGRVPGGTALGHRLGADWAVLVDGREDPAGRRLTRRITSFRDRGDGYVRADEVHELELIAAASVAEDLRQTGFRVRIRRGYRADLELPGHRVLIARRSS